jgi:hypothetical protein
MTYSKAKLKSSGDKASPCFRPFSMVNLSDRVLSIRTLLQVSDHTNGKDISQLWYLFKRDFFACAVMNLLDACTFF